MAWSLLAIPGAATVATIAGWATKVVNNFRYLKGIDGVVTTQSGLEIDNSLGTEYLKLPSLSTAETATVLTSEGQVAFDETTHQIKLYNGTAVKAVISEADVDDTPVNGADTVPISSNWAFDFINELTTAGDLPYATAAGVWHKLGIGTVGQVLRTNAAQDAPEWAASIATKQFHVPCFTGQNGALLGTPYAGYKLNSTSDFATMTFRIPNDWAATTTVKIIIVPIGTGTFDWTVTTSWGGTGQAYNVHTDSATADAQAGTNNQLLELDISAAFTPNLATNDIVNCVFTLDTLATITNLDILGLDFKYT